MHIDWFVFAAQIFNFLLLMYLLKRFLFGRILKAMDDREAKIVARFAEADTLNERAREAAELYETRNRQVNEKIEQMLNEATLAAETRRKELMDQVRVDIESVKARWQDMLKREQEAFFFDLRRRAANSLYATARKALSDLADAELEERILDEFLRRLGSLEREKIEQIRKAVAAGGKQIVVQSAFEIPAAKRAGLEDAVRQQFAQDLRVRYLVEPDVVSGIELRVNGHKIAWSLNEYLETLVENLTETLQREAHAA